ncbi:MAG: hypothetical protein ACLRSW_15060 [Christensenellaceae bacterium]
MVKRKDDTPQRIANRKYEAKNKEKRRATNEIQTMIRGICMTRSMRS